MSIKLVKSTSEKFTIPLTHPCAQGSSFDVEVKNGIMYIEYVAILRNMPANAFVLYQGNGFKYKTRVARGVAWMSNSLNTIGSCGIYLKDGALSVYSPAIPPVAVEFWFSLVAVIEYQ